MLRKMIRGAFCAAMLTGCGMAMASQPTSLSDDALDSVSAGATYTVPTAPTSVAFAHAFSSATAAPGLNVIVDVAYSGGAGINQKPSSTFDAAVTTSSP